MVATESQSSPPEEIRSGSSAERKAPAARVPTPTLAEECARGRNLLGKGTREVRLIYTFLLIAFLTAQFGMAQATPDQKPAAPEKKTSSSDNSETPGPTAFVQFGGNYFNMGVVGTTDFNLGYRFNSHLSADLGLPLIATRTPFSLVATKDWRYTTIIGAPYIDVRYDTKRSGTNITSILTGAGGFNMVKTYSNGRMTLNWFNHFDRNYQVMNYDVVFTPFLNIGAGTGTVDRQVMPRPYELARPYETLGYIGNGEVGGAFTFKKFYRLEGSLYGLAPVGTQKVYSRIVAPDSLLADNSYGAQQHYRYWDQYFETGGQLIDTLRAGGSTIARSSLAKDNGFGIDLEINRFKFEKLNNFSLTLGFTQSQHYHYGSSFLMLRYNFTGILRNLTTGE